MNIGTYKFLTYKTDGKGIIYRNGGPRPITNVGHDLGLEYGCGRSAIKNLGTKIIDSKKLKLLK